VEDKKLYDHTMQRREVLKIEHSRYKPEWESVSDYVLGYRPSSLTGSDSKASRNELLYNEKAKEASKILVSGMQAGITSPARPWMQYGMEDRDLMDYGPVKEWLDNCQKITLSILARSNFYKAMLLTYRDISCFGVTAKGIYENFDDVARFEPYGIGSYFLGTDGERKTDALYREQRMSIGGMVKRFGRNAVSSTVKNLYDKGKVDSKVKIVHAIEKNDGREFNSPLAREMAWRSTYIEEGAEGQKLLLVSGFESKPFTAPRWQADDDDVYSNSYPGIDCLNTNKSLQVEELDYAIAREKMHNPPLVGDASLRNSGADLIAGGITYVPNMSASGKPGLAPVYDVNPRINELVAAIKQKESRIDRAFYADLFLMITDLDRAQITATEIAERKEEKMLMMGPVLESLNTEEFDPEIDRVFNMAQKAGLFPPPPQELENVDLKIEYISVLHQAQKAVSTASIEATTAFAANLSVVWPEVRHKIKPMQAVDEYAQAKGASPKILRGDEEAQARVDAENQALAQQQAMEQGAGAAQTAKTLSEASLDEDSVLQALTGGA